MTQEIAVKETDPMLSMIERVALSPDADIAKLEKMLDMQERVLARDAKQEFYAAFAEMQSEIPDIAERATGHNIKYATLEDINEQVKPILKKYGFGILFKVSQPEAAKILITGILSHRGGHSEETSMLLPSDTSGSKNAVQAIGSSTSYGKRYVLCALLNISTRGEDDNGAAGGDKAVIEFQAETLKEVLMACSAETKEWFAEKYGAVNKVPQDHFTAVLTKLQIARSNYEKKQSEAAKDARV